jgi:hypothetical protein
MTNMKYAMVSSATLSSKYAGRGFRILEILEYGRDGRP